MVRSKWNYDPARCSDQYCSGNCWWCRASDLRDGEVDDPPDDDED